MRVHLLIIYRRDQIAADYWIIKRRQIDVPALYNPHGRYRYNRYGINWQGMLAFLLAIGPNLPGLAYSINSSAHISAGAKHLYTFDWLYGFVTSIVVYVSLHKIFPAKGSLVDKTIDGVEVMAERKAERGVAAEGSGSDDEKFAARVSEQQRRRSEGYGYANVDPIHRAPDVYDEEYNKAV